jgi:murein DD-endopeptidase MepM/ murein hydrolase activator NlpD
VRAQVVNIVNAVFRDRQLIVREGDTVRALHVSACRQKWVAGAGAVIVIVVLASAGGLTWQSRTIAHQDARLESVTAERHEARRRFEALMAEARALRATVPAPAPAGVAARIDARTHDSRMVNAVLARLDERRHILHLRAARADQAREQLASKLDRRTQERAALQAELAEAREALHAASSGQENLGERLADTLSKLYAARAREAAQARRISSQKAEIDRLSTRVADLRERRRHLAAAVTNLSRRADRAREARDRVMAKREQLAARVGKLESTLGEVARGDTRDLVSRIEDLKGALVTATRQNAGYRAERAHLQRELDRLRERLEVVQARHMGLFTRYSAQAKSSVEAIENTVAMTGLDVDVLLAKVDAESRQTGGPFVPVSAITGPAAQQLDKRMGRLQRLQRVLSVLPLTAPLDSYWISSRFGKRRDPFNGRWAMHEGLDLAANPNLAVRAAAPGKVVKAGRRGGYGRMVEIDHGLGITTRYGHLKSVSVTVGEHVKHRGTIGKLGSTGRSTGPHVHYEIRVDDEPVDPMNFLKAGKHVFKR